MGIELHITVPHNFSDISLVRVVDTFRSLDDVFGEISRHYLEQYQIDLPTRTWASRDTSDWDRDFYSHPLLAFDAPADFSFYFGPSVISIHPHTRLGLFCTDPKLRQLIRRFTHLVLKLVSGDRAIYSPNDYEIYDLVFDGRTFAQIESHLLLSGKPASSFAAFDGRRAPPAHYYYIDRFEDFRETTIKA